jgi:hypothetical protein
MKNGSTTGRNEGPGASPRPATVMPGFCGFDALLTIPVEGIQMTLWVHGGQGGNVPGFKMGNSTILSSETACSEIPGRRRVRKRVPARNLRTSENSAGKIDAPELAMTNEKEVEKSD